jgi:Spy/CpxP family protein refolding chaperone
MSLHRISAIALLILTMGGSVALANSNHLFSQAGTAVAQNPDRPQRDRWMDRLNLTAEQKQKIQAIHNQYKDQISQQQQALRQQSQQLRDLMAGTASADQIRSKHQEIETLQPQLARSRFESMLAVREVLTPDQRRQFAEIMQQKKGQRSNQGRQQRGQQQLGDR